MGTIIEIVKPCEEAKSLTQWDLGRKIIIRPDAETIIDEVRFSNVLSKEALVVEPSFDEQGNIVSGIPNILLQSSLEIYVSVAMHFKDGKCVIHKETLEVTPEKKPSDYIYTEIEIKNYEELEQRIKTLEEQGAGGNGKPGSDGFSPIANVVETITGAVITITDKNGTTTATVKNGEDGKDGADGAKGDKGEKGTDGTSVAIKNISESTVDGGNNVVTFSDGQKMIVKNGRKGDDGKTAYQYAQDGGYDGTEKEFSQILAGKIQSSMFYVATDYGISDENENNTSAMQALVDMVHENGGGVIYVPKGTYKFKRSEIVGTKVDNSFIEFATIWIKSNVSILGESMSNTVFKQVDAIPYAMFAYQGTKYNPIVGCYYKNFTVDAYDTAWNEETGNKVYSKAFAQQYLKDCAFSDIMLKGTLATALGVDYLDNVRIKNITLIDCGRAYDPSKSGRSGIGIGTGGSENENFTIHNCAAIRSGQYGVFVENQTNLNYGGNTEFSKGSIISNCIVRDGMNKGIGIVGGQNITVIGCQVYDNESDGIFIDGRCKNVTVTACNSADNGGNGVAVDVDEGSKNVVVANNTLIDNAKNGIEVLSNVDLIALKNNHCAGNVAPLKIGNHVLHDAVIQGNSLFGDVEANAFFTGNTAYNDLIKEVYTAVGRSEFLDGIKIMPDGSEATQDDAMSTDFIDISKIDSEFKLRFSSAFSTKYRVCQYDADKNSFYDNVENPCPMVDAYDDNGFIREKTFEKLDGASYIRIFVSKITDANFAIEVTGKEMESDGAVDKEEIVKDVLNALPTWSGGAY